MTTGGRDRPERGVLDLALRLERLVEMYPDRTDDVARFRELLRTDPGSETRDNGASHVTGSGLVFDHRTGMVALTFHRKLGRWLQMGGHWQPGDSNIADTARRECIEESGLTGLKLLLDDQLCPIVVDVDIHEIPSRKQQPSHLHYDVRFVLESIGGSLRKSDESDDIAFFPVDEALRVLADTNVARYVIRAARLYGIYRGLRTDR